MDISNTATRELPRYKCHKEVWALQINAISSDENGTLHFVEAGYAPIKVGMDYMFKHNPAVGGYYVVYDDGYASYSPSAPFEAGYTRIN